METALPLTPAAKTGVLFVNEGLITPSDVKKVLSLQEKARTSSITGQHRLFGTLLCSLNLITPIDNFYILDFYKKHLSMGEFLNITKIIPQDELNLALTASKTSNLPLISMLIKKKLMTLDDMRQIVFSLYHIPLRSIDKFQFSANKKNKLLSLMGKDQARKNSVIPLVIQDNTVLIGITDPVNLLFVRQLNLEFLQYRFKTVFILFHDFNKLYKSLYGCSPDRPAEASPIPLKNSRDLKPDLSLLFGFKITISDPKKEHDAIDALYRRYELLRKLTQNRKRDDKSSEFQTFIRLNVGKIMTDHPAGKIEILLKNRPDGVTIVAVPRQ